MFGKISRLFRDPEPYRTELAERPKIVPPHVREDLLKQTTPEDRDCARQLLIDLAPDHAGSMADQTLTAALAISASRHRTVERCISVILRESEGLPGEAVQRMVDAVRALKSG